VVPAIRLAIVDEHEILRRGLEACFAEDAGIHVAVSTNVGPLLEAVDLAVVSTAVASQFTFACPLLICGKEPPSTRGENGNTVLGVVPRNTLTAEQLLAAVHAAAVGLHVDIDSQRDGTKAEFDDRQRAVLQMLADGADTLEIAASLRYSERTVKGLIQGVEQHLGAQSRAHAVALAIRRGII
jgi:DNA-binding CsgD family transcriptional regulator